eukprot:744551-Rhodomonas_salina.1
MVQGFMPIPHFFSTHPPHRQSIHAMPKVEVPAAKIATEFFGGLLPDKDFQNLHSNDLAELIMMEQATSKFTIAIFHWSEGVLEGSGAVQALKLIQGIPALGANCKNNTIGAKKLDNLVWGFRLDISSQACGAHDMVAYLALPLLKALKDHRAAVDKPALPEEQQQLHEPAQSLLWHQ